jgi:hypothetical protein
VADPLDAPPLDEETQAVAEEATANAETIPAVATEAIAVRRK